MLGIVQQVRRFLRKLRPDLLHAHYVGFNGLVAALSGYRPFVVTAWGSDVLIAGTRPNTRPLVRFTLKRADLITCDAEHMRLAIKSLGVQESLIRIIHFGTDTELFNPTKKSFDLRKKLGFDDSPTIISLRSLEPIYDIATLIHSMPFILKEVPNARLLIIGDGSEKENLMALATRLGVEKQTTFLGFLPQERVIEYLLSADVYVSTSLSDAGLAASTAEAMACALPVVITDSAENRLWVQDGKNGYIVPTRHPEALAAKISYLLKSPDLRTRLGVAARKTVLERNNYHTEMAKMEDIYREVRDRYAR